jgi:hypothetical protein
VQAYAALHAARAPLIAVLGELSGALASLCTMLDEQVARGLTRLAAAGDAAAAASGAAPAAVIGYALAPPAALLPAGPVAAVHMCARASERARELSGELVSGYQAQLALTQAAIVSVLPQSCSAAWREHCRAAAAASAAERSEASGSSSSAAPLRPSPSPAEMQQSVCEGDAGEPALPPFGLDAAGERAHERLTVLVAAVAVQPYAPSAARRADVLAALEHIAGAVYDGG